MSGIPVTTVARTLVDLAGIVPQDQLAKAFREAENPRRLDVKAVRDVVSRPAWVADTVKALLTAR